MAATKKVAKSKKPNTVMAIVAYILFFIPLLTDSKDDAFVKFHVKQGLVLFLTSIAVMIFSMVPIIGWLLSLPLNITVFVFWVIGIMNAINGEMKELPIVGKYAKEFSF